MTAAGEHRAGNRIESLDGLRGVAALIVLVHHTLLTNRALAEPYFTQTAVSPGTAPWWLVHTPLHLLWEGAAAVYVFFVLSGVVLTLPVLAVGRRFSWVAYYPHRLLRLYLPVWGAVALAAVVFVLLPRTGDPESLWLQAAATEMHPRGVAKSLTLVTGTGGLISPLWSLRWEVIFSLLVPVYIWVALKARSGPFAVALVLASVATTGAGSALGNARMTYLPMFMVGVVLAVHLGQLRRAAADRGNRFWAAVLVTGLLLCTAHWVGLGLGLPERALGALVAVTLVGATLVVVAAIGWRPFAARLSAPVPLWLGTISFSLYLTHEPIVVGLAFVAGDHLWWSMPTGIVVAIVVGWAFYRVVERPSHRFAQSVRRRAAGQRGTVARTG